MRLSTIPRKADFQVELGAVRSEVDISIVDRLNSLLQPQKLVTTEMMASHMYTSYNKHISLVRTVLIPSLHSHSSDYTMCLRKLPIIAITMKK